MSYWIHLTNNGKVIETDTIRSEGGTYVVGGQSETELNVTYNYGKHFDFMQLHDLTAQSALEILQKAINKLNNKTSSDYWKPTEGNVKKALTTLAEFAEYAIKNNLDNAVFEVS